MAKQNEIGRSMMEMMGVLSIIGVLSIGSMFGAAKMLTQQKINKTVEQVGFISSKLSQIGAQSGSYEGLNNKAAIKFGAIPSAAIDSLEDSTLINPFGESIEISSANLLKDEDEADQQGYTITYKNIPEEACVALASHRWSSNSNSSLIGVGAGNGDLIEASIKSVLYQDCKGVQSSYFAAACADGDAVNIPMDPGIAASVCNCPKGNCVVVWMYF